MTRVNLYRPMHVGTLERQQRRAMRRAPKLTREKGIAVKSDIRGLRRNLGPKVETFA